MAALVNAEAKEINSKSAINSNSDGTSSMTTDSSNTKSPSSADSSKTSNSNSSQNGTNSKDSTQSTNSNISNSNDTSEHKSNSKYLQWGTLPHLEIKAFHMDDENVDKHCTPLTWSNCDSTTFEVRRGPNYKPNSNQKASSGKSLYNVFGIDTYKSPTKINKLSQFVDLTERIKSNIEKGHEYNYDKWPLPPIIILNMMIPDYSPSLIGADKTDGKGFSLVLYAELSDETRQHLEKLYSGQITKSELLPSVRLFSKFVHASESRDSNSYFKDTSDSGKNDSNSKSNKNHNNAYGMSKNEIDEILQRFKLIVRVMNYSKTQMPYAMHPIVTRYNAKPFLARTSSTFYHEPGKYFAVDIDAHIFGKLARKSLGYLRECMETVIFDGGFVIEGKDDDELPEQILCSARISKIGAKVAKDFPKELSEEYSKRKKQNTHTSHKHDCNSKSMMDLMESKQNEAKTGSDASKTVPVIDRDDVMMSAGKEDDNGDQTDSNVTMNGHASDKTEEKAQSQG